MIQYINIVIFVILLIFSAFFSASEVALVGINRAKVKALAESGKRGKRLEKLKNKSDHFLITILIGNNIANVGASALATAVALDIFGDAGVAIATGIVTLMLLIFGEIGPKTYSNHHQEKVALLVSTPIYFLTTVLSPFFWIFDKIKNRGKTEEEIAAPAITEDEIREWIDVGEMEGALEEDEKEMIYSVLRFNDTTAKEIMTPRPDVIVIEDTTTIEEAVESIKNTGFSRVPVFHEFTDNIVGTLNFKDLFNAYTSTNKKATVRTIMIDAYFVPESKKIDDLLRELQVRRVHMAIVLDEFGGFSGVVTFEDILEELVGDIMDESDGDEVSDIIEIGQGLYMLDAQTRVAQLNERFGIPLPEDPGNYETVGGLVFSNVGHIPRLGESITLNDVTLIVTKMKNRQILKIKMILPQPKEDMDEDISGE
ncbi:MAG: hemolysin family protein [Methanocorpusculum sp.]|nr:hemolysin family protein [Methanocorpusculum sp.]